MRRLLLRRVPLAAALLVALLAIAYLAFRDASAFAIRDVAVRGTTGPDGPKVEAALRQAAREMTTLNVDAGRLRGAVRAYPTVEGVEVDRDLPHGVTLTVLEHRPVAVVVAGGRRVPLASDGRLLQGATPPDDVPALAIQGAPGSRVDDPRGRRLVALAAAAPGPLRRRAMRASITDKGLTMTMERGPDLYFGTPSDLAAKWKAAARVLADPSAEGATYVDVRVPERAAAGGVAPLHRPEDEAAPEQEIPATEVPSSSTGA
jgi:cell division protein FtsQ